MRVLIVAPGTRGDVAPMAGLGARLQADYGFDVAIAANPAQLALIESAGLEYRELAGDLGQLVNPAPPGQKPKPADLRRYMNELAGYMDLGAYGTLAAAQAGADVVLANSIAPYAFDVAEALNIPAMGVFLQPIEPSRAYAPVTLGTARNFTAAGNKLLGSLIAHGPAPYDKPTARIRRELGLADKSRRRSEAERRRRDSTILHGFSPAVVPRPKDWRNGLQMTGYWWPDVDAAWSPPSELEAFLADGPAPVFIGCGSTGAMGADFMLDVVERAGVRAVLQGVDGVSQRDAISIGPVPHEWLFPRVSAAVHHGGAGTTAAALRAGVPSVAVPIFTDQPFWAARIHALGAGPEPIAYKNLAPAGLARAIRQAQTTESYAENARGISRKLLAEDGVAPVAAAIERVAGTN
ncbi:glycosyltransferase [Arthrobacter castelli]|uniref:glycosyltransferase n=1 Tax=Arthrobacter castelli TaxID=271431 RepID=UPI0004133986|nr:glycosyltransferase [Arthrobacter castelli]